MALYEGARTENGIRVTVDKNPLNLRLDLINYSAQGFDWGYDSPGAAQLALAILARECGPVPALAFHQTFKAQLVTRLNHSSWKLDSSRIETYLQKTSGYKAKQSADSKLESAYDDHPISVIIFERFYNEAEQLVGFLSENHFQIQPEFINNIGSLARCLAKKDWDLILTNPQVGENLLPMVTELLELTETDIPVIAIIPEPGIISAEEAFAMGAADLVITKNREHLLAVVRRELNNAKIRQERHDVLQLYRELEKRYVALFEASEEAITYVLKRRHKQMNVAYKRMFGFKKTDDISELSVLELIADKDTVRFMKFLEQLEGKSESEATQCDISVSATSAQNSQFPVKFTFSRISIGGEPGYQVIVRDLSASGWHSDKPNKPEPPRSTPGKPAPTRLSQLDRLTGHYNQQYFTELLEKAIADAVTKQSKFLFLIKLTLPDGISAETDVALDEHITREVSKLLSQQIRPKDSLAKLENDLFAVLVDAQSTDIAQLVGGRIQRAVRDHVFEIADDSFVVICSISIFPIDSGDIDVNDALTHIESLRKAAPSHKQGSVEIGQLPRSASVQSQSKKLTPKDIQAALTQNRCSLQFQPIINFHGKSEKIYEVSLNMRDEDGNSITPKVLSPVLESYNLGVVIDRWIIRQLGKLILRQQIAGDFIHFFIQPSTDAIIGESVAAEVEKLVHMSAIEPQRMTFAFSEKTVSRQIKNARTMVNQLNDLGCTTALYRFNAEPDSLILLDHLAVHYLKIDQSLIEKLDQGVENQEKLKTLQRNAKEKGKMTIAPRCGKLTYYGGIMEDRSQLYPG